MINSFKYVFVETKSSWIIGSSLHSLSFSSDGTTIAGTTKDANKLDQVQFWDTATGVATFSFEQSSLLVFSPNDPDLAVLVRPGSVHIVKRDSFGGKTWGGQYQRSCNPQPGRVSCAFNSNGKTFAFPGGGNTLQEHDTTSTLKFLRSSSFYQIESVVCCPTKPGWFVVGDRQGEIVVVSKNNTIVTSAQYTFKSHGRLTPVYPVGLSACAWSQDGKWIATGNAVGDIFLWNAGDPSNVSFSMLLPRNRPNISKATTSLVFVPDSTALIIISGGYLSVWDISPRPLVPSSQKKNAVSARQTGYLVPHDTNRPLTR